MLSILLGSLGFIFYFVYDINSVTKKYRIFQVGFTLGSVLVALGTFSMVLEGWNSRNPKIYIRCVCWFVVIVMFGLLIYTLFFALPFNDTYVEQTSERKTYTEGVYALCRHPGVLWYAGMYIALIGIMCSKIAFIQGMIYILWNVVYVILQDISIFPKTFIDYGEYKKMTPFLIPNRKSIQRCIKTLKRGGQV